MPHADSPSLGSILQIPIPLVARLVRVTFERSVSRALLFLLGFYWIPEVTVKKHAVRVE